MIHDRHCNRSQIPAALAFLLTAASLILTLAACSHTSTEQDGDDDDNPLVLSEAAKNGNLKICRDSSLYTCVSELYARDITTVSEEGDFSCITFSDNATLCPSGTAYRYNSAPFEQACALADCNKTFETLIYRCRANLPGPGGTESRPSTELDSALHQAYEACLEATAEYKTSFGF